LAYGDGAAKGCALGMLHDAWQKWPDRNYDYARQIANHLQVVVLNGGDPVEQERAKRRAKHIKVRTFKDVCEEFIAHEKPKWRPSTLDKAKLLLFTHSAGLLSKPIAAITPKQIDEALKSAQKKIPNQAERARRIIFTMMNWAEGREYRSGPNPARLDALDSIWLDLRHEEEHAPSLPYPQVPILMARLRELQSQTDDLRVAVIATALEFLILNVTRRDETRLARWEEFNLKQRVWIAPKMRTKQKHDHHMPLALRSMEILERQQPKKEGYVFIVDGNPISTHAMGLLLNELTTELGLDKASPHGFRTSFVDWGDPKPFKDKHLKRCLGHRVGDKTDQAYDRDNSLEERVPIMAEWAKFCEG
jgi:integrase